MKTLYLECNMGAAGDMINAEENIFGHDESPFGASVDCHGGCDQLDNRRPSSSCPYEG